MRMLRGDGGEAEEKNTEGEATPVRPGCLFDGEDEAGEAEHGLDEPDVVGEEMGEEFGDGGVEDEEHKEAKGEGGFPRPRDEGTQDDGDGDEVGELETEAERNSEGGEALSDEAGAGGIDEAAVAGVEDLEDVLVGIVGGVGDFALPDEPEFGEDGAEKAEEEEAGFEGRESHSKVLSGNTGRRQRGSFRQN